jgi:ubiquitin carboxyl-terminal hydrolase 8
MLFSNRDKFDLVAVYDEYSQSSNDSLALKALMLAIYERAFKKVLKNMPMILVGGLRAWKEQFPNDVVRGSTETTMENPGFSADVVRYSDHSPGVNGVLSPPRLNGTMAPLAPLPSSPALNSNVLSNHSRIPAESSTSSTFIHQSPSVPPSDPISVARTISGGPLLDTNGYKVWMPPPSVGTPAPPDVPAVLR